MYKHTQIGWFLIVILTIGAIFTGIIGFNFQDKVSLIVFGFFILALLLFYRLTVECDEGKLYIVFGIGIIKKTIEYKNIHDVNIVKNKWWFGWGIRIMKNTVIFNISGFNAIELTMKDGFKYRIGTNDHIGLNDFLKNKLKK